MNNLSIRLLSLLLTLFIGSMIIFKIENMFITHLINLLLLIIFLFLKLANKETYYESDHIIYAYFIFTLIGLMGLFWAENPEETRQKSLLLIFILFDLILLYNITTRYNLQKAFLNGILLGAFVNYLVLFGIIQPSYDVYYTIGTIRAQGTLGNPNLLAVVMLISIFCSIAYLYKEKELKKWFFYYQYINLMLSGYVIFLTVSKKGILFGLVFLMIFLFLSLKKIKNIFRIIVMVATGITLIIYFVDMNSLLESYNNVIKRFIALQTGLSSSGHFGSTAERKYFIELGWNLFTDKPLLGYGLDGFSSFARTYSHNNHIEVLVSTGIFGYLAYYSMYFYLLYKSFQLPKSDFKYILIFFVLILIVMDMAIVSYYDKFSIFIILLISILIKEENNTFKANRNEN